MVRSEPIIQLGIFPIKSHVILPVTSYEATATTGWPPFQGDKQPWEPFGVLLCPSIQRIVPHG